MTPVLRFLTPSCSSSSLPLPSEIELRTSELEVNSPLPSEPECLSTLVTLGLKRKRGWGRGVGRGLPN